MARPSTVFVCASCGGETLKWQGQCPACGEWNSLESRAAPHGGKPRTVRPVPLQATPGAAHAAERFGSGLSELDRVLGGGIVPGAVVLVGGEPGIGKSTLLLQVAAQVAAGGRPTLYASGEESVAQIASRAARLSLAAPALTLAAESALGGVLELAQAHATSLLIVDSIQTVQAEELASAAGSVGQLRECTQQLVRFAKGRGCAVLIVGHVTKDGAIAGPKLLEHLVDAVLYFQSEATSRHRIIRATKNRYGPAHQLGFFAMTGTGLKEVRNPAAIFLARGATPAAGSLVTVTREGGRPLLIELQGLVDRMRFGAPRRVAQGLDANRLAMLLAAAHRHAGLALQEHDVFVNVVGGIEIAETAWDLPVILALASSLEDRPLPPGAVAFGEVGLTGEVRPVPYGEERLHEAAAQGFRTAILPKDNAPRRAPDSLTLLPVTQVAEALQAARRLGV
ncbi:MAG: DNA repair protein RadA [Gammaproteobacteria bacterium]|nr:DNA repair protein RadA [Gammaproteobacteria bacterium]